MLEWLQAMENRVGHLRPVAVDLDIIKQQQDELRPLAKEYRDFSVNIDKVCFKCNFRVLLKSVSLWSVTIAIHLAVKTVFTCDATVAYFHLFLYAALIPNIYY